MKTQRKLIDIFKSNNFYSLSTNVIAAFFGFITILILARSLDSQNDFGVWMIYLTASGLLEMFRFSFCKLGIVRFLAGAKGKEREAFIGTNWIVGLVLTVLIVLSIVIFRLFIGTDNVDSEFYFFLKWYPLLAVVNLPYNSALSILQADMRFKAMLFLKTLNIFGFFVFVLGYVFISTPNVENLILGQIVINLLVSFIAMKYGWDGIKYIVFFQMEKLKVLLKFGYYSVGAVISSNLLKSSDTFLIALSPLGAQAVAIYSIPLKIIEIIEIPLRSFTATSYPEMSKLAINNQLNQLRDIFYKYAGLLTFLVIPILIGIFIFAEELVFLVGGAEYLQSANILRILAIYGLFLPIDRYTGVTLDSINQPKLNMIKVLVMVSVNIIGDIIVLNFWNSLWPVALVTVLTVNVGMILGVFLLKKHIDIKFSYIIRNGWNYLRAYVINAIEIINSFIKKSDLNENQV